MVAEVSGLPVQVNFSSEFFERGAGGSVETKVVMWSHLSRAFINGKTRQALALSYSCPAEKRSVQSISKMPEIFAGFDCVDLCVDPIIYYRLLQCQGDGVRVLPGRTVNVIYDCSPKSLIVQFIHNSVLASSAFGK